MTNPTPTGNGCTLEDCYTNLFALTDLDGIKWRKLQPKLDQTCLVDPLDDPVLQAYTRCIHADVLCVWRRSRPMGSDLPPAAADNTGNLLLSNKELWMFWYGKEPDKDLTHGLQEAEIGSWDSGDLSYDCRTLLFKAIHNLIEKCLLGQNFVRIGKWFVQPFENEVSQKDNSAHLSISFSFFLHGESQVCASIDVRQHPPLYKLQQEHLGLASHNAGSHLPVILAPYGLAGTLTGQSYKDTDQTTQKLLEEWKQFYVLQQDQGNQHGAPVHGHMPPAVEVIVAGVRMRYPTCYVLYNPEGYQESRRVTMEPPAPQQQQQNLPQANPPQNQGSVMVGPLGALTPPTSPGEAAMMGEMAKMGKMPYNTQVGVSQLQPLQDLDGKMGKRVVEKIWQDAWLTASTHRHQPPTEGEDSSYIGSWEFTDPCSKSNCNCSKGKPLKNRGLGGNKPCMSSGHNKLIKQEKPEPERKPEKPRTKSYTSFHRRLQTTKDMMHPNVDFMLNRSPGMYGAFKPTSGVDTVPSLPNPNYSNAADSPISGVPSPLVVTPNQPATSSQNGDPTMPTLSPHPPNPKASDRECRLSQSSGEVPDDPGGGSNNINVFNVKLENGVSEALPHRTIDRIIPSSEMNGHVYASAGGAPTLSSSIKRPILPSKEYDDEEPRDESLYDFTALDWIDNPVKKLKLDSSVNANRGVPQTTKGHVRGARNKSPSPPVDPFEFSDEASTFGVGPLPTGTKRKNRSSTDSSFTKPSPYGKRQEEDRRSVESKDDKDLGGMGSPTGPAATLTRTDDLVVTMDDLDQLFEPETDEDSNGPEHDMFMPGDDQKHNKYDGSSNSTTNALAEMTKMFPTPPSIDTGHSPGTGTDIDHLMDTVNTKTTEKVVTRSVTESVFKDWSFVYKPPMLAKVVASTKYCPIDIPSKSLPSLSNSDILYKPWSYSLPIMDKSQANPISHFSIPLMEPNVSSHRLTADRMTSIEASPAAFSSSQPQRTPGSYDLQSPASNASSYLNKTLDSVNNTSTNYQIPEVHSLVVNVLLSDSSLNLFKDHNFDSCNICVCNMNIKGSDVGLYLPDPSNEPQYKCACGFSAVVNRKYGTGSGLFYEDEVDITGIRDDRLDRRKPSLLQIEPPKDPPKEGASDGATNQNGPVESTANQSEGEQIPQAVLVSLQEQFSSPFPSCFTMQLHMELERQEWSCDRAVALQMKDGCEACYNALEQGRQAMDHCTSSKLDDPHLKSQCLHKWPFIQDLSNVPANWHEVVHFLKNLKPTLQDAIHKNQTRAWEVKYTISGPLSWKDFHLMSGRASEETSMPQPIPTLLMGYEKDWVSLAPYAIPHWDKLLLEPYSQPRNVAYVIVAPENEHLLSSIRLFFKELSTMYELCRFGRHVPVSATMRDGILRVGKTAASKVGDQPVDDWFTLIGNSTVASKIKLYAQVCKHRLAPFLASQSLDKLFADSTPPKPQTTHIKSEPSPAPAQSPAPSTPQSSQDDKDDTEKEQKEAQPVEPDVDNSETPSIVIYLVNPFMYAQKWGDNNRLAALGLLRCYQELVQALPETLQNNIHLQVVPLNHILDNPPSPQSQYLKQLAFSIYTQSRRSMQHSILGRTLTGFGPASDAEKVLKTKDINCEKKFPSKLFSPPYILGPNKDSGTLQASLKRREKSSVLFCAYCLSEDQRWLLAVCTDEKGEMLETCTINIEIPNRNRRKKASARKIGLSKLWDYLIGVMAVSPQPWRLVIGRFGRLGHGELKGWSELLRKKNLQAASEALQSACGMCEIGGTERSPCVLSACLTSIELHQTLYVMPHSIKQEERQAGNLCINTPEDASVTHILVFPTSSSAQKSAGNQPADTEVHPELPEEGDMFANIGQNDDFMNEMGIDLNFDDIFNFPAGGQDELTAPGSPGASAKPAGIPGPGERPSGSFSGPEVQDAQQVSGQPMAMGYYLTTAKPGPLPKWFWQHCPHREKSCPICFKAALHIHCSRAQQRDGDSMQTDSTGRPHPLDSFLTCDVLRYVLETYNALSWLTMDPKTNDRRSCLPAHLLVLMQLYHAMNAYV